MGNWPYLAAQPSGVEEMSSSRACEVGSVIEELRGAVQVARFVRSGAAA